MLISYRIKNASNAAKKIEVVEMKQAPETPIKRPKTKHEIKLKKGKIKIHKYIRIKCLN